MLHQRCLSALDVKYIRGLEENVKPNAKRNMNKAKEMHRLAVVTTTLVVF